MGYVWAACCMRIVMPDHHEILWTRLHAVLGCCGLLCFPDSLNCTRTKRGVSNSATCMIPLLAQADPFLAQPVRPAGCCFPQPCSIRLQVFLPHHWHTMY